MLSPFNDSQAFKSVSLLRMGNEFVENFKSLIESLYSM